MQTKKTELSIMKYIAEFTKVSLSVCPVCRIPNYLSSIIVRSERDISTAILVAKFTCIERLEEVTLIFSKYHVVADNPIWRQTTVRNVRARQERESTRVKLFKSIRESMRVHELEAKRQRGFQLPSIVIKI